MVPCAKYYGAIEIDDAALGTARGHRPTSQRNGREFRRYRWHTGQKNVERPVCTMRLMVPVQPGVGQRSPARS